MVDYQDPATIAEEFVALVKFWHVINGIFIWEFFTTLYFEWDVIRGNRPYRWTIWIYSSARVCTLTAAILNMIGFDTTTPINCQLYATSEITFAYCAFAASSLLIILRTIAIWNRAKIVFAISMGIWIADIAILINAAVRLRSTWSHETNSCLVLIDVESNKLSTVAILFTDVVLLLIMLIGLFRMRLGTGNASHFWCILWKQGLIWLFIATIAEVTPVVFMALNLNESLDIMFQNPCMTTVTIAATRMYRSLVNFCSSDLSYESSLGSVRAVSDVRVRSATSPLNRMEVSVRTEHDQFPSSYVSTDQGEHKAHKVSLSGDLESGPGK